MLIKRLPRRTHPRESRNPELCSQTEIWIPAFANMTYTLRILILLNIYVELRLDKANLRKYFFHLLAVFKRMLVSTSFLMAQDVGKERTGVFNQECDTVDGSVSFRGASGSP